MMGIDLGRKQAVLSGYAQSEMPWEHGAHCPRGAAWRVERVLGCSKSLEGCAVWGDETVLTEDCALWDVIQSLSHPNIPECFSKLMDYWVWLYLSQRTMKGLDEVLHGPESRSHSPKWRQKRLCKSKEGGENLRKTWNCHSPGTDSWSLFKEIASLVCFGCVICKISLAYGSCCVWFHRSSVPHSYILSSKLREQPLIGPC